jgi:hypothetical protein
VDDDAEEKAFEAPVGSARARVASALGPYGVQLDPSVQTRPIIVCTSGSEGAAQSVRDALDEYFLATMKGIPIAAPWNTAQPPTPAQATARRTFRVAIGALHARMKLEQITLSTLVRKDRLAEGRARRREAIEAAVVAARLTGPIDGDVVRLIVARNASAVPDARGHFDEALRQQLGALATREGPVSLFSAQTARDGAQIRVELTLFEPYDVDMRVPQMVGWLLAQSCDDVRLRLENVRYVFPTVERSPPSSTENAHDPDHP